MASKLFFQDGVVIWRIMAQISTIKGAAHGLLHPCNSNERNAHLNRQKSRDWCTVKFFDLQSSGVFGRNHCSSEASMSLDLAALWFQSPALESVVMFYRRLTEGLHLPLYFDRLSRQTNVILERGFGIYNSGYGVLLQKFTGMHSYGQRMF